MAECMWMPDSWEEFIEDFSFIDGKEVYTNGSELIAVFRVKQMVEHYFVDVTRCKNCNWWHRHKSGDTSRGVCDKYAVSKSENGYCDEPLLEERKRF